MSIWQLDADLGAELGLLALAFALSLAIGVERSRRQKSAGLRTHVLVCLGSAMFTLVSAYGFESVLGPDVVVDPSRIAAQIVSGIGFLGAGVIFVRHNVVNGLTSAATIWMVAAIGMACGAGMPFLAIAGTLLHLITVGPLSRLRDRVRPGPERIRIQVRYLPEHGALKSVQSAATALGMPASLLGASRVAGEPEMRAVLEFQGSANELERAVLVDAIGALPDVQGVTLQPSSDDE
ncbi:MgtC/SapB family protein [Agromyces silvae]|uniref:MgtC/SapB family protein n=1 Tax=Agromyces silvae TaxID=3388266 RepID=UPI00280ACD1C|nr:MgtC/SapB family protein [Agromyces protaetiae]